MLEIKPKALYILVHLYYNKLSYICGYVPSHCSLVFLRKKIFIGYILPWKGCQTSISLLDYHLYFFSKIIGGNTNWKPPLSCKVYNYLNRIGCFFLHPRCSKRKDAADFAICMHVSRRFIKCRIRLDFFPLELEWQHSSLFSVGFMKLSASGLLAAVWSGKGPPHI